MKVAINGAGIAGTALAYRLSRMGLEVLLAKRTKHLCFLLTLAVVFGPVGRVAGADGATPPLTQAVELLDSYRGKRSMLQRARTILAEIIRADPSNAAAHRELARFYIMDGHTSGSRYRDGSLEAAESSLKKALDVDPNYAEAYVLAGHLYHQMGRPADAKAALSKAESLGTDDPWLQNNWADILVDEGKHEEAAKRYLTVIDAGTSNKKAMGAAFQGLTRYYIVTGRLDEADAVYKRKIVHEPESAWNYGNYAHFLLCRKDDYEAAIFQARRALRKMNYGAGRSTLAAALYRRWADQILSGDVAKAQSTFTEAAAIMRGTPADVVRSNCGPGPALRAVHEASSRL